MAATTKFEKGVLNYQQAATVVAAIGSLVGRLAASGKTDSLKDNPECQLMLEGIVAMVNALTDDTDADYSALIQCYNVHGIINYMGQQLGAGPGVDTELLFVKPGEVKH